MAKQMFENDVKTYGTQAIVHLICYGIWFENDVKTYGTQAVCERVGQRQRLRMM